MSRFSSYSPSYVLMRTIAARRRQNDSNGSTQTTRLRQNLRLTLCVIRSIRCNMVYVGGRDALLLGHKCFDTMDEVEITRHVSPLRAAKLQSQTDRQDHELSCNYIMYIGKCVLKVLIAPATLASMSTLPCCLHGPYLVMSSLCFQRF
jgi:hypothetical protein